MAEYRGTVRVAADPSEVLPYVADLTNLTEWDSSVRAVVPAEGLVLFQPGDMTSSSGSTGAS